jgi:hypothetical protein
VDDVSGATADGHVPCRRAASGLGFERAQMGDVSGSATGVQDGHLLAEGLLPV